MAPQTDKEMPHEHGLSSQRPAISSHGSSGEGAGSAMARLISQEQARIVAGAPEDAPNASS